MSGDLQLNLTLLPKDSMRSLIPGDSSRDLHSFTTSVWVGQHYKFLTRHLSLWCWSSWLVGGNPTNHHWFPTKFGGLRVQKLEPRSKENPTLVVITSILRSFELAFLNFPRPCNIERFWCSKNLETSNLCWLDPLRPPQIYPVWKLLTVKLITLR